MKRKKQEKINTGFFTWLPKEVALSDKLNHTDKYVFSALLSLSNNPYTIRNGLKLMTNKLANMIGISRRVLQYTIKNLSEVSLNINEVYQGPLIEINKVHQKKYKQVITLNFFSKDAFVLIPTEIINDKDLSVPSKLFYGQTFAARNGYSYSSILEMADYTRYHKSSVYRHINILTASGWIIRDTADINGYRYLAKDKHSEASFKKKQNDPKLRIEKLFNKKKKKEPNAPPVINTGMTPEEESIADSIWHKIAIIPFPSKQTA